MGRGFVPQTVQRANEIICSHQRSTEPITLRRLMKQKLEAAPAGPGSVLLCTRKAKGKEREREVQLGGTSDIIADVSALSENTACPAVPQTEWYLVHARKQNLHRLTPSSFQFVLICFACELRQQSTVKQCLKITCAILPQNRASLSLSGETMKNVCSDY